MAAQRLPMAESVCAPVFLVRVLPLDLPVRPAAPLSPQEEANSQEETTRQTDERPLQPPLEVLQMSNEQAPQPRVSPQLPPKAAAHIPPGPPLGGVGHWFVRHILRLADSLLAALLLPFRGRLRWVTVAAAAIAIVSAIPYTHAALGTAVDAAQRPFAERAAFNWQESLGRDLSTAWTHPSALEPTEAGTVRVDGLTLNGKTMGLKEYQMDFAARIDKKAIGWIVRAADPGNYYAFKLADHGRAAAGSDGVKFDLVRYQVIDGHAPDSGQRYTAHLVIHVKPSEFLNISTRVSEDQIITIINGFGVDEWKHLKMQTGGLGFLAENGESFQIKSLAISGNEDFLGLFLWGAQQTYRSVRQNVASLTANRRGAAAPAVRDQI
jgi:hypothetical protein